MDKTIQSCAQQYFEGFFFQEDLSIFINKCKISLSKTSLNKISNIFATNIVERRQITGNTVTFRIILSPTL